MWTLPPSRTKAGREHRIPLSNADSALLASLPRTGEYVFPGTYRAHMSVIALHLVLQRMGQTDITVHGFRSSFSTWARETTGFPRELIESALAHTVGDAAERAYARGDALERRRALGEYAYQAAGMANPVRITTRPDYFDEHSDSLELWSPGSPSFPMPEAEAMQQELAGISISTLLKPPGG